MPSESSAIVIAEAGLEVAETNACVYRGWLLVDQLRAVYAIVDPKQAAPLLDEWLYAAGTSLLVPFIKVARTLTEHRDASVNAIRPTALERETGGDELDGAPDLASLARVPPAGACSP